MFIMRLNGAKQGQLGPILAKRSQTNQNWAKQCRNVLSIIPLSFISHSHYPLFLILYFLSLILYPLSIHYQWSLIAYPLSLIPYLISHTPLTLFLIPYPLSIIPFTYITSLKSFITKPVSLISYSLSHIPYFCFPYLYSKSLSLISYPLYLIPNPVKGPMAHYKTMGFEDFQTELSVPEFGVVIFWSIEVLTHLKRV